MEILVWIVGLLALGFLVGLVGLLALLFLGSYPWIAIPIYIVIGFVVKAYFDNKKEEAERVRKEAEDEAERARKEAEDAARAAEDAARAAEYAARMEKGESLIEEVSEASIERAADRMAHIMYKYGLSCHKCGKVALPELGTKKNYTCHKCGHKFASSIHNLKPKDVLENPILAIRNELYNKEAALPYNYSESGEAERNEAWKRAWEKIELELSKESET